METALKISNLTKYGRKKLDNINLEVFKNTIFVLVGNNKAGKTTLLKNIAGLQKHNNGEIFLFSKNINFNRFRKIGVVFPDIQEYENLSVIDNLKVNSIMQGLNEYREMEDILKFIGLDKLQNKKVVELSFYEKAMLKLGVALVGQPDLLLLDEPLKGLNKTEAFVYSQKLSDLRDNMGITILLTTNNLRQCLDIADTVGFMNNRHIDKQLDIKTLLKQITTTIEIRVDDVAKTCILLEQCLNTTNYEVLDNTLIEIYDDLDITYLNKVLVENNIKVSELVEKDKDYGGYNV